jgi:hypothetical protein
MYPICDADQDIFPPERPSSGIGVILVFVCLIVGIYVIGRL